VDVRDAEAGALRIRDAFGQGNRLVRRHAGELGCRPVRATGGGVVDPHALAEARRVDAGPNRVDVAGPVLVRNLSKGRQRRASRAHFRIRRVHSRHADTDSDLPGSRNWVREFDDFQHTSGWTTLMVDGGLHQIASPITAVARCLARGRTSLGHSHWCSLTRSDPRASVECNLKRGTGRLECDRRTIRPSIFRPAAACPSGQAEEELPQPRWSEKPDP